MKVLTIKTESHTYDIHMLNVGETFWRFGGSRHGLTAGRDFATGNRQRKPTASMVVRTKTRMTQEDVEYDIYAPDVWAYIAKMLNEVDGIEASAPNEKEEFDTGERKSA